MQAGTGASRHGGLGPAARPAPHDAAAALPAGEARRGAAQLADGPGGARTPPAEGRARAAAMRPVRPGPRLDLRGARPGPCLPRPLCGFIVSVQ